MSYKQIKVLILILPTVVIGLWEHIRHTLLLPYLSMDTGNYLSPVIIFIVTITILRKLFLIYEHMQEQLEKERAEKAVLQERERIARELHDGMAQSLFLYSVQINRIKKQYPSIDWTELEKSLRQMHDYVRHAISNLKNVPSPENQNWQTQVKTWIDQYQLNTGIPIQLQIQYPTEQLNLKEKVELFACVQEALTNIRKHAKAKHISILFTPWKKGWKLIIEDDGIGWKEDPFQNPNCFGLKIMRERACEIGAHLSLERMNDKTKLIIKKEDQCGNIPDSNRG
ncbi:sensor histidine kinase [Thermoflavimicrobium dichotomicum]|uniref:histidine kinase n=1 Tax=Thermoflavimicrobium dichotomicum TaxID=46223 RepID=A0A1I3QUY9_9BACL|nr:histidine kinase [Thermoflavimicrobium dichotomicum]SFJ36917.1 two-component system, NarL family, nitrate/nitrite sensor histidine kinase NarQ [Thermoflavimicrobium dichotomicum]